MPANVSRSFFSPDTSPVDSCQQKALKFVAHKKECAARSINLVSTGAALPSALKNLHAFSIKFFIAAYATTFGQIPSLKAKTWTGLEKHCLVSENLKKTWVALGLHLYKFVMFCTFSPISSLIVGAVFSPRANKKIHDKLGLSQNLTPQRFIQKENSSPKNPLDSDKSAEKEQNNPSDTETNQEVTNENPRENPPPAPGKKAGSSQRKYPPKTPPGTGGRVKTPFNTNGKRGVQRPPIGDNTFGRPLPDPSLNLGAALELAATDIGKDPESKKLIDELSPRSASQNSEPSAPPPPPPVKESSGHAPVASYSGLLESIRAFKADALKKSESQKNVSQAPSKSLLPTNSQLFDKAAEAFHDEKLDKKEKRRSGYSESSEEQPAAQSSNSHAANNENTSNTNVREKSEQAVQSPRNVAIKSEQETKKEVQAVSKEDQTSNLEAIKKFHEALEKIRKANEANESGEDWTVVARPERNIPSAKDMFSVPPPKPEEAQEIQQAWSEIPEQIQASLVANLNPVAKEQLMKTLKPADRRKLANLYVVGEAETQLVDAFKAMPENVRNKMMNELPEHQRGLAEKTLTRKQSSQLTGNKRGRVNVQSVFAKK
ncbi:MAG: hypothetical protein BGO14_03895 [Chlamydiales bacterium 38-26]|nr:hypothetical protein [Chlamydiales bacterium]OJV07641.1 MAG: hypothetical protein BGO14_03895 [Chlamydiales bacterium 38-26]